jgi:hypothetical protein
MKISDFILNINSASFTYEYIYICLSSLSWSQVTWWLKCCGIIESICRLAILCFPHSHTTGRNELRLNYELALVDEYVETQEPS